MDTNLDRQAIRAAARQLREANDPFGELEALAEGDVLFEILGKWPPDGTLPVPVPKVHEIALTVEKARRRLPVGSPNSVSSRLRDIVARLRTQVEVAAPPRDPGPMGPDDGGDESDIVGPWPP